MLYALRTWVKSSETRVFGEDSVNKASLELGFSAWAEFNNLVKTEPFSRRIFWRRNIASSKTRG